MADRKIDNPFVGLRPFNSDEDILFFGREQQTMELMQRLHKHHFVAVIGSSGSGKSSLIKAGLIPNLEAGYLVNEKDRWLIASMKPGQDPLFNLCYSIHEQLKDIIRQSDPANTITKSHQLVKRIQEEGIDALLNALKPLRENNVNFFLLVDQFEELFRFTLDQKNVEKKDEATEFVNILLELAVQTAFPLYVVITMRSDFIGDCTQFYGLPEALNQSQYLVPRLNRAQLKTTIEGPVKLFTKQITAVLTARLLNDLQQVKDELPLLQHALMRIWDKDTNNELDLDDYESIGGIEKALSNHADEALRGMTETELRVTKKIFQTLTTVDENGRKTRRPARVSELQAITGSNRETIEVIIHRFIKDNRSFLVVTNMENNNDKLVDISHESLIRQWSTLSGWVDEESESAKIYDRLVESTILFHEEKRGFLTGRELQLTLQWYKEFKPMSVWAKRYHEGFETSIQYLQNSEEEWEAEEKNRNRRKRNKIVLISGLIGVGIIILGLSLYTINEKKLRTEATTQTHIAIHQKSVAEVLKKEADSSAQASMRDKEMAYIKAEEARLASLQADYQRARADSNAQNAMKIGKEIEKVKEAFRLNALAREKEDDDPTLALRIAEAALNKYSDPMITRVAQRIFENHGFYKILVDKIPDPDPIIISPDGKTFLTNDGLLSIEGKMRWGFKTNKTRFHSAAFSKDLKKIITGSDDDTVRLWSAEGNLLRKFPIHVDEPLSGSGRVPVVAFSPNGKKIFAGYTGYGRANVWNLEDTLQWKLGGPVTNNIVFGAFSPDSKNLFIKLGDTVGLWNIDRSCFEKVFKDMGYPKMAVFSPDGENIITERGLWKIEDSAIKWSFNVQNSTVCSIALSPDGKYIATANCWDSTAMLWDLEGNSICKFTGHSNRINTVVFDSDGKNIITSSLDSSVRSWSIYGALLNEFQITKGEKFVTSMAFSLDGKNIIVCSDNEILRLHTTDGHLVKEFKELQDTITAVAFLPDNKTFFTGSPDGSGRFWNLQGSLLRTFNAAKGMGSITCAAFSPDGMKVLTGSSDGFARLWTANGTRLKEIKVLNIQGTITSANFTPDGNIILIGATPGSYRSRAEEVLIYNIDGSKLKTFNGYSTAAVSPDGKRMITGSKFYKGATEYADDLSLYSFRAGDVISVAFSEDGKRIFTGTRSGAVLVWESATTLDEFLLSNKFEKLSTEQKKKFNIH